MMYSLKVSEVKVYLIIFLNRIAEATQLETFVRNAKMAIPVMPEAVNVTWKPHVVTVIPEAVFVQTAQTAATVFVKATLKEPPVISADLEHFLFKKSILSDAWNVSAAVPVVNVLPQIFTVPPLTFRLCLEGLTMASL